MERLRYNTASFLGIPFSHSLLKLDGDNAKLSNFLNRHKNAAYTGGFDAAPAFNRLIQPRIVSGEINAEQALRDFHEFLRAEDILDTWTDIFDYRQCLIAAFAEAFPRRYRMEIPGQSAGTHRGQRLPPSPFFTGREAELDEIGNVLQKHGTVILSSMGGIGKSVLAEEYARRSAGRYTACQIVTAEPWFTSYSDLIRAVQFNGGSVQPGDRELLDRNLQRLCILDQSSLLIFNNVDKDLEDYGLFRRILRESGAHIIVTTRNREAFPEGEIIEVDALRREDQIRLLEGSAGREIEEAQLQAAHEICRRVGGHTLLIQLLGRAMRRQDISSDDMLKKLEGRTGFEAFVADVRVQKDDFNKTVRIKNFIADVLFRLEPFDDEAQDMLRFLTLLPLEGVPGGLITAPPFDLDEVLLRMLVDSGWVHQSGSDDMIRLHPVVREAILSALDVDSGTCTPFLMMLSSALQESKISLELPYLLRIAVTAVEMLYISDSLRSLLLSNRLQPLYDEVYDIAQGHSIWSRLSIQMAEMSTDEELLPRTAAAFQLFAYFCEYMEILNSARAAAGRSLSAHPFSNITETFEAFEANGGRERLNGVLQNFLALFTEVYPEAVSDSDIEDWEKSPVAFL